MKKYHLECFMTHPPRPAGIIETCDDGTKKVICDLRDISISHDEALNIVNKLNNYQKLLDFVKKFNVRSINPFQLSEYYRGYSEYVNHVGEEAEEILREIGEL